MSRLGSINELDKDENPIDDGTIGFRPVNRADKDESESYTAVNPLEKILLRKYVECKEKMV